MTKWMMFHLDEGKDATGQRIMDSDAVSELHTPQLRLTDSVNKLFQRPEVPGPTSYTNYAMGFRNGYYRGTYIELNSIVKVTRSVCKTVVSIPIISCILVAVVQGSRLYQDIESRSSL